MKTYKPIFALILALFFLNIDTGLAQQGSATVTAQNNDISDNLDLQAVASVFGDAKDLEDFEKKLNDPSMQLSNLDLNGDGYVDYLRVIEVAEGDSRVIVIQSVLGQDKFQDVATIELEKVKAGNNSSGGNSNITVQIVGNPYLYGANYIYEPYYYSTPVFFDYFWLPTYRPYFSPWYWGYYPTYFSYWAPMSPFHYHRHVYRHINQRNRFVYTDSRRLSRADRMYSSVSRNSYERSNPSRSFSSRNANVSNRHALETSRGVSRNSNGIVTRSTTVSNASRSANNSRSSVSNSSQRSRSTTAVRNSANVRNTGTRVRSDFNSNIGSSTRVNNVTRTSSNSVRINGLNSSRSNNMNNVSSQRIERRSNSINSGRSIPQATSQSRSNSGSLRSSSSSGNISRSGGVTSSRGISSGSSGSSRGGGGRSSR